MTQVCLPKTVGHCLGVEPFCCSVSFREGLKYCFRIFAAKGVPEKFHSQGQNMVFFALNKVKDGPTRATN